MKIKILFEWEDKDFEGCYVEKAINYNEIYELVQDELFKMRENAKVCIRHGYNYYLPDGYWVLPGCQYFTKIKTVNPQL